jgi:hypothetical protein
MSVITNARIEKNVAVTNIQNPTLEKELFIRKCNAFKVYKKGVLKQSRKLD